MIDPVRGADPAAFDEGVLEARPITPAALAAADVILLGAPARQGGLCGEMRLFLDSLAPLQAGVRPGSGAPVESGRGPAPDGTPSRPSTPAPTPFIAGPVLKGKVGAAFTSIGGHRGAGGAESVLASVHATLLAHGMVVVGAPPSPAMAACPGATTLGAVAAEGYGGESGASAVPTAVAGAAGGNTPRQRPPPLTEAEVRIAFSAGQWAAQVGRLLHDADLDVDRGEVEGGQECVDGFGL